jgi:hypothetical protein
MPRAARCQVVSPVQTCGVCCSSGLEADDSALQQKYLYAMVHEVLVIRWCTQLFGDMMPVFASQGVFVHPQQLMRLIPPHLLSRHVVVTLGKRLPDVGASTSREVNHQWNVANTRSIRLMTHPSLHLETSSTS